MNNNKLDRLYYNIGIELWKAWDVIGEQNKDIPIYNIAVELQETESTPGFDEEQARIQDNMRLILLEHRNEHLDVLRSFSAAFGPCSKGFNLECDYLYLVDQFTTMLVEARAHNNLSKKLFDLLMAERTKRN